MLKDGEEEIGESLIAPIRTLEREAKIKTVRKRAKEALAEWESRKAPTNSEIDENDPDRIDETHVAEDTSEGEWNGFAD